MASLKTCWVDEMHESLLLMFSGMFSVRLGGGRGGCFGDGRRVFCYLVS